MCGIIGHVIQGGKPDTHAVRIGMQHMQHRGPDGEGILEYPGMCFGHRRLSIIDLEGSKQPWQTPDGRYTIVFNGEIYNYLELRNMLVKQGVQFRSQGDTEVLLAMYVRYGADCLNQLNGMFAFAVWDNTEKKVFLARDRLGKKPLYYAITVEGLVFASEITALKNFSWIDKTIDLYAVYDFFAHQSVGQDRTIYKQVRKLKAGHYLEYQSSKTKIEKFWSPPLPHTSTRSFVDICEEFSMLLDDSVRLRLRSDVPLGSFLSGGLDSSLIVSCLRRANIDVQTFTVGFNDTSYDESIYAQVAADYFSTKHRSRHINIDVLSSLGSYLEAFGEPFADPSAIPMGYLCQHAREYVTVALSGDGVDELFGGYKRYYARKFVRAVLMLPERIRKQYIASFLSMIPDKDTYYGSNRLKQMKLLFHLANGIEESPRDPLAQTFTTKERNALITENLPETNDFDYLTEYDIDNQDSITQMMMADVNTYLIDDILVKVDRMSMHHSLEVRSPFLDYRIVELACKLPLDLKIQGSTQKYLVRQCYRKQLPSVILDRKKHGFAVPLASWFRGLLKSTFESVVLGSDAPDLLNKKEILRLWMQHQSGQADNGFKLWSLLVFCYWYSQYQH